MRLSPDDRHWRAQGQGGSIRVHYVRGRGVEGLGARMPFSSLKPHSSYIPHLWVFSPQFHFPSIFIYAYSPVSSLFLCHVPHPLSLFPTLLKSSDLMSPLTSPKHFCLCPPFLELFSVPVSHSLQVSCSFVLSCPTHCVCPCALSCASSLALPFLRVFCFPIHTHSLSGSWDVIESIWLRVQNSQLPL